MVKVNIIMMNDSIRVHYERIVIISKIKCYFAQVTTRDSEGRI